MQLLYLDLVEIGATGTWLLGIGDIFCSDIFEVGLHAVSMRVSVAGR